MIVELAPCRENKNLIEVSLDGMIIKTWDIAIFGRKVKLQGETLPQLQAAIAELEYSCAKRYALRKLAMKSWFSDELAKALQKKLVSKATIDKIIKDCKTMGFLDDDRWLESFIHSCQRQKKSATYIMQKLRNKGVSEDAAVLAIKKIAKPELERQNLQRLLATRYKQKDLSEFKERQKVIASLLRKGYCLSDIQAELQAALKK